jgi:D-beta-D-heptose 7-phosphate kinase/D-beta-D-heptose 1-phosphate adenosyltransferase
MVDAVTFFDEDTPLNLINTIRPDVLVKGGDYTLDQIVGAKEVLSWGGRVVINPIVPGFSTTAILEKITKL